MRKLALLLWALIYVPTILLCASTTGYAQQLNRLCYINANGGCTTVGTATPLPVTSGGGGGGAVTIASGGVASGAYSSGSIASGAYASGSISSGAIVDLGAQADAVCGTATGTCSLIALLKYNNSAATPTGTNNIGAVQSAFNVTLTDCSGTITAGGTAQNAFAAGATKHGFIIQNIPDAVADEPIWVSFTGTAAPNAAGSYLLNAGTNSSNLAGGSFASPMGMGTNAAVSIVSATTGKKFSCSWW